MKKKLRIAAFALFMPLAALTGCGGTAQSFSFNANWYRNTALKANIGNTLERLEYEVTFESASNGEFSLEYTDGVYRTELRNESVELDSESREGYVYTTELSISVCFDLGGQKSEVFEDTVHTEVQFLSAAEGLRPLRSYREVHSHVPVSEHPASMSVAYNVYDYSYTTEYDDALTTAETVLKDLTDGSIRQTSYDISSKLNFLDNEQILFALRGLDLSVVPDFYSVNSVSGKVQALSVGTYAETSFKADFEADGAVVTSEIAAYSISLGYKGSNRGQPQTLVYAKTTDFSANAYRNVLLQMDSPILHTLGTLRYRLTKAEFANK